MWLDLALVFVAVFQLSHEVKVKIYNYFFILSSRKIQRVKVLKEIEENARSLSSLEVYLSPLPPSPLPPLSPS